MCGRTESEMAGLDELVGLVHGARPHWVLVRIVGLRVPGPLCHIREVRNGFNERL